MANIFRKKDSYIDRVNRSTFDLSFVNNLTMKFGAITPVCLLPASFGDSFQINARFNLQLLPTVFPIQTQLYVRLHFVYVRTRTIWEDWMTFFGGDETVSPPWMDILADGNTPSRKDQFNIPHFDFEVPTELPGVDPAILDPRDTYADPSEWEKKAQDLASRFIKNFAKYEGNEAGKKLVEAGPKL